MRPGEAPIDFRERRLFELLRQRMLVGIPHQKAVINYIKALNKGILKVMSKMGISTLASYCGAQIFEAIGLNSEFIDRFFTHTTSRVGGVCIDVIAREACLRHERAFGRQPAGVDELNPGGEYQWRRDGEYHLFNPETVFKLQHATRSGQYGVFKEYTRAVDTQNAHRATLRGLFRFKPAGPAITAGSTEIRIGGYLGVSGIFRSTASGGGPGTSFASFPYEDTATGNVSETRLTAQPSRLSIRVNAAPAPNRLGCPLWPEAGPAAAASSGAPMPPGTPQPTWITNSTAAPSAASKICRAPCARQHPCLDMKASLSAVPPAVTGRLEAAPTISGGQQTVNRFFTSLTGDPK